MVQVSNSSKYNRFFYSSQHSEWLWGPSILYNEYQGPFLGVKQSGHEVIHSPPSNVKVKNEWSYPSPLPTCLHYVSMGSFIFTINNLISTIPAATVAPAMREQPVYSKQQIYG